mgnify:CR=1 FL=1
MPPPPIPPLYTVYLLRSLPLPRALYIGSTPAPPRRLRQHNGETVGGASRTARASHRPWAMPVLVVGFPSQVGALQFEYVSPFCYFLVCLLSLSPRKGDRVTCPYPLPLFPGKNLDYMEKV